MCPIPVRAPSLDVLKAWLDGGPEQLDLVDGTLSMSGSLELDGL